MINIYSFVSWPTENLIFYCLASKQACMPNICINVTNMRYTSKRELTLIAALKFYFTWSKPLISDWHGCVSKTSPQIFAQKIHRNILSEHLNFWPGWLCRLDIFSQAPNIHPSPPHPPLNQGHRCAMAKVNCIGYDIYTHVDFLWIQSINLKILKEHCFQAVVLHTSENCIRLSSIKL